MDAQDEERIAGQLQLLERARELFGNAPYFGHLRIETAGHQSEVLLGRTSRGSAGIAIVDWHEAPIAEVFFSVSEGELYELDVDGRVVEGRLLERSLLAFDKGELVEIGTPSAVLSRRGGGPWRRIERRTLPELPERRGPEATRSSIEVILDPAQQRLVDLPRRWQLLILGEAGFGKTTVALHRLAALRRGAGLEFRAAVIVPTEGLRRLTRLVLERLGIDDVEVEPYDRWAAAQARRAFRDVPRRESQGARSGVIQLKRHPALREVLANIAGKLAHDDEGMPLPGAAGRRARRTDLHHLFGDRALMEKVAARAGETVVPAAVNDIVDHTRIQFTRTSEETYSHLGSDRLATLDGRAIDDGTPTEDAWTIDVEDYAVLFELDRLRAEGFGHKPAKLPRYDCLVVDEAQELAPLELALLGRSLDRGGTLIVAGDAGQQIDPAASFLGWESTMRDLSAGRYETATLQISYRCPEPVTEVARALREPRGAAEVVSMPQGPISCARAEHELHLASWLVDELRRLRHLDPLASIALLCRTPEGAQTWARHLNHGLDVRLALEGRFDFKPGVTSTSVAEVKGLEFDYAILPDAAPASYPDLPEARRALYVAVTRATHRLVLATPGRWSPLLSVKIES